MKLKLLILLVCTCTIVTAFAQTNSPLVLKKKGVFQDEKLLKKKEIKNLLTQYPESATEYNQAFDTHSKIGSGLVISGTVVALVGAGIAIAPTLKGEAGGSWVLLFSKRRVGADSDRCALYGYFQWAPKKINNDL
jgi:hypothetical protein